MRFLVLLLLPFIAAVEVDLGWSGAVRTGAWTPVLVTADGDGPATIELYVPGAGPWGQRIRRDVVLTDEPQTFPMYARIDGPTTDVSVRLFGADGRTIDFAQPEQTREIVAPARLVGVGGTVPNDLAALDEPFGMTAVGVLPMLRLPREAVGYDGLDLLVLPDLDPADLPVAVANAIADWVRSGGRLAVTFATSPRLGDGRLDQMLREPGEHGLGEVSIGVQDWSSVLADLPEPSSLDAEPFDAPRHQEQAALIVAAGLLACGFGDMLLMRLLKRRLRHPVPIVLIVAGFAALLFVPTPFGSESASRSAVVQASDAVVRSVSAEQVPYPNAPTGSAGWITASVDGHDAELTQLTDGNRLDAVPAAITQLDLTPAEPVLLLVGDRLAAVGSVSVDIDVIHHRGVRRAGGFTLEGGKVVDLATLEELGAVETRGTLIEGEVDGQRLRAVW